MAFIPLDIRTLSIVTFLFAFISALSLVFYSIVQKIFHGLKTIGFGLFVLGCGFLLICMRHYIPIALSVVVANMLILGGAVIINDGICRFRGVSRSSNLVGISILIVSFIAISHYTYNTPSIPWRIFYMSIGVAVLLGLCARSVIRNTEGKVAISQKVTAAGLAVVSVYLVFRGFWALNEGALRDFMSAGTVHGLAFLAVIFVCPHIAYGVVWIAGASMQEELHKYKRIIEATPDVILLVDGKGVYKLVNNAALNMMGIEREDMLGKSSAEILGSEVYDSVTRPNLEKALRGEMGITYFWYDFPAAGRRYLVLSYHPVPDDDGTISHVAINARDITEQHLAREDRQRIFKMSLDMLCVAGMDGKFKEVNPAWEKTLGWSKKELLESPWIEFVHPDDVQATLDSARDLEQGRPIVDFINRYRTKTGAYRFISWTSHPDLQGRLIYAVARDVTERMELEAKLKAQAVTDPLTGAGNRRLFMRRTGEEIERCIRYGAPLSLLMLDIDHFKAVNDTFGHGVGDEVLKALAAETRKQLRASDVFCRIGGEEFAVLLINADGDAARGLAERIRQALSKLTVSSEGAAVTFTVSLGGTERAADGDSVEAMLKRADKALYAAKQGGRNRVEMA